MGRSLSLVQLQALKINSSTCVFKVFAKDLSNLVHDFLEDCFPKPKRLLAANRLIYLNISIDLSKTHGSPLPSHAIVFYME